MDTQAQLDSVEVAILPRDIIGTQVRVEEPTSGSNVEHAYTALDEMVLYDSGGGTRKYYCESDSEEDSWDLALLASLECPADKSSPVSNAILNGISRIITSLLRHNGLRKGLVISEDGFTSVGKLLDLKELKPMGIPLTVEDIRKLVRINDKQRFSMTTDEVTGEELI